MTVRGMLIAAALCALGVLAGNIVYTAYRTHHAIAVCDGKFPCLKSLTQSTVQSGGINAGYEFVQTLYDNVPTFRRLCSRLTQEVADDLYAADTDIKIDTLSPAIATCNYGFLQEYPRALLLDSKDTAHAASFCTSIGARFKNVVPGAEAECWRGVGRGLPFMDKALWGDARAMAALGISQCRALASGANYTVCLSGVFNILSREEVAQEFKLVVDPDDPIKLCKEQTDSVVAGRCFGNYKSAALSLIDERDTTSAITKLYALYGSDAAFYVQTAIWAFGYNQVSTLLDKPIDERTFSICTKLTPEQRGWCIDGMSVGFAKNGRPGMQGTQVLSLCAQVFRSIPDFPTDSCPSRQAVGYIRGFYTPAQFEKFCATMKQRLGFGCKEEPADGYGY